ncbi:MAG: hypothetical protein KC620_23005 [Myxococcales bacterium]|nr:hypothetical protein [Myxococcales bacterium]
MRCSIPLLLCGAFATAHAEPPDLRWTLTSTVLGLVERNRPDAEVALADGPGLDTKGYLSPRLDDEAVLFYAGAGLDAQVSNWLSAFAAFDTGLMGERDGEWRSNGRPMEDEVRDTWLLRSLGIELLEPDEGRFGLTLGKQRISIGQGLIFDEYALGGEATVSGEVFSATAGAWWPGRGIEPSGWPMLTATARWQPDPFTTLSVYGLWTRLDGERGEQLAHDVVDRRLLARQRELERQIAGLPLAELLLREQAEQALALVDLCVDPNVVLDPWWLGTRLDMLLDGHVIGLGAALGGGGGTIDLDRRHTAECAAREEIVPDRLRDLLDGLLGRFDDREIDLSSFAIDAYWRAHIRDWLYLGAYFVWMSGDDISDDDFDVFLAIAPFLPRPALFFGSGLGSGLAGRAANAAGYEARGVIAPGLTALVVPVDEAEINLSAGPIFSDVENQNGGRRYGDELDVRVAWRPDPRLRLSGEMAALLLGDFFADRAVWWRASLSIDGFLP